MHETPQVPPAVRLPGQVVLLTRPCQPTSPRHVVKWLIERIRGQAHEGHRALINSVRRGLRSLGQRHCLNPLRLPRDTSAVLVCWGHDTIGHAAQLHRRRQSPFVLALAPTTVTKVPEQLHEISRHADAIDIVFPASAWQQRLFEDAYHDGVFAEHFRIWPAGVDAGWWHCPMARPERPRHVLIYKKACHDGLLEQAIEAATAGGWTHEVIHYGSYTPEQFRRALGRSRLAIFLSWWESQGIALAEAWSCDVPTLAWHSERDSWFQYTAPYLGPANGLLYHDEEELRNLLNQEDPCLKCAPRQWVIDHMSDEASTRILLAHLHKAQLRHPGSGDH